MTASHGRRGGIIRTNISRSQARVNGAVGAAAFNKNRKTLKGLLEGLRRPQDFDAELASIDGVELWDDLPMNRTGDDE